MKHTIKRFAKMIRFLIAGGSAAVVNLGILYILTDYVKMWYVLASVYAFIAAFFVSFLLQKYWTFKEQTHTLIKKQMLMYLGTAGVNILIGTALLYIFVEYVGLHYLFGQIISQGLIAFLSYFVYQHVIFKERNP